MFVAKTVSYFVLHRCMYVRHNNEIRWSIPGVLVSYPTRRATSFRKLVIRKLVRVLVCIYLGLFSRFGSTSVRYRGI